MGKREPLGSYSVRRLAAENEKKPRPLANAPEEAGDAVPVGRSVQDGKVEKPVRPSVKPGGENPYRVRERMAEQSARRAKLTAARASSRKAKEEKNREDSAAAKKKPLSERINRPRFRPHTDDIFTDGTDPENKVPLRRKRTSRIWITVSAVVLILAFSVGAGAVVYKTVYRIDTVHLEGSGRYSAEQILAAAGVQPGDNLYSFSSRVAKERVTLHYPRISDVSVARSVPGTVIFTVTEEEAVFRTELYGEQWAISPSFRLLYPVDDITAEMEGLILLALPTVQSAVAGRPLAFLTEGEGQAAKAMADLIRNSPLSSRVTSVNLRQPYTLQVVCDHLYLLDFGDRTDVELKLKVASAVLKDELFNTGMRAKIDLSVTGETSVVLDDQIDLGE